MNTSYPNTPLSIEKILKENKLSRKKDKGTITLLPITNNPNSKYPYLQKVRVNIKNIVYRISYLWDCENEKWVLL